ncbi:MAG: malic enzyme-like NAD(P)-binding protein [Pseudomonadota bacterium]
MFERWFRKTPDASGYTAAFKARASKKQSGEDALFEAARAYHAAAPPGKMASAPTKPLSAPDDLALAYSPGVAAPCLDIAARPEAALDLTNKGATVAVMTNGTALLGLGDRGPLASKPVMEGKAALFARFAGLNAVDVCIDESDPRKLAEIITALEPSFGGVNLEDVRAPDCFEVERICHERMTIPLFHDDQHGTAVCVLAALENALRLTGRRLEEARIVTAGAGAAAIACVEMLVAAGAARDNITLTDRHGVVYAGRRENMDPRKSAFAKKTKARALGDVVQGADVFLGLSVGGVLSPEMAASLAERPIILALANPFPEIWPEDAAAAAPGAIIATGRSDYPNQVNNVLCFPFLFRGALDVGARRITRGMTRAAADAIAALARSDAPQTVRDIYPVEPLDFGTDYILPKPFDPRLLPHVAAAVAAAAMSDGVATRPIGDFNRYGAELSAWSEAAAQRPCGGVRGR